MQHSFLFLFETLLNNAFKQDCKYSDVMSVKITIISVQAVCLFTSYSVFSTGGLRKDVHVDLTSSDDVITNEVYDNLEFAM